MRQWLVVALKEIKDNLRDKRAFFFAIVYGPIFMPLMIVGPMLLGAKTGFIDYESTTEVHVQGMENAPNLVAFLKTKNLVAVVAPENFKHKIREGELDAVLEISAEYGDRLRKGEPEPLFLYVNRSNKKSEKAARHLNSIVNGYSGHLGYWRVHARGFDYELTQALKLVEHDLSSEGVGGLVFGFLIYFILVFTMMTGGFYLAVDITAGERERNSLEPLLALPISRFTVVFGKFLAILSFVTLSGFLSAISLYLIFTFLPFEELATFLKLDGMVLACAFLLALPCALLVSCLLMATAAFTKSAKEAQTYISLLFVVPMVPMFIGQFADIKASANSMAVPFYGQYSLIDKMVKGETILPVYVLSSVGGTLIVAGLLFAVAVFLYRQEKILSN